MCKWLLAPPIWDRLATRPSWLRARYVREGVVHGLDKVALDVGDLVASGGEGYHDLKRIFRRASIQQNFGSRVRQHTRLGFDEGAHFIQRRFQIRLFPSTNT